ncbi:PH domain-containing protein [Saccharibacillus sp. CPCC 101409]|uniref:PH domain-containing protein n=1 Tax=Saccharibacillus sp. CPCC 101409 TaxID=3058041 RepID=UPI002671C389|nr:PH domain-containing protein [Saccharibacillus sp. CPCC 101409]MDO3411992.1 PH domain-containing protein [Saccharibacillus sp. CPCC 101409]
MHKYKSDKDPIFFILHWATVLVLLILVWMALSAGSLLFIPVWLLILMFIVSTWYLTRYEIQGGHLLIRSGPLNWKIPIDRIETVRRKRSLSSGPAHARDRLEIVYAGGSVLISPEKEQQFLSDIKSANRKIKVDVPIVKKDPASK